MGMSGFDFAFRKIAGVFNSETVKRTVSTARNRHRIPVSRGIHSASTSRTGRCAASMRT